VKNLSQVLHQSIISLEKEMGDLRVLRTKVAEAEARISRPALSQTWPNRPSWLRRD
jgi:hypothetical protein